MDYKKITKDLQRITKKVGDFLIESQKRVNAVEISEKSTNQLVSEIDVTSEKMLVEEILMLYPKAGFITEENTIKTSQQDLIFIIDPLDGTTNFLHGLPLYSISIAATYKQELVSGVVLIPVLKECFYATKNEGSFLNGEKIRVSESENFEESLLATGFPYYNFKEMDSYLDCLQYLMENTRGLRRMGSAAIDLAYTAAGRFCGFYELHLNTWDVAAGALLVREAGGVYTDFKGNENDISGKEIVAGNKKIHAAMKALFADKFQDKPKQS